MSNKKEYKRELKWVIDASWTGLDLSEHGLDIQRPSIYARAFTVPRGA